MSYGQLLRLETFAANVHGQLLRLEAAADADARGELLRLEVSSVGYILLSAGSDRVVDGRDLVTINVTHQGTTPTSYLWSCTHPEVVLHPDGSQVTFVAPAAIGEVAFDVIVSASAAGVASPAEAVRVIVRPHNEWTYVGGQWVASGEDEEVVL